MSISSLSRESTRPPIALSSRGLLDHAATTLGLWLLHWAKRAETRRADRASRRAQRMVRQAEFDRLLEAISDRQADIESTITLRAMR